MEHFHSSTLYYMCLSCLLAGIYDHILLQQQNRILSVPHDIIFKMNEWQQHTVWFVYIYYWSSYQLFHYIECKLVIDDAWYDILPLLSKNTRIKSYRKRLLDTAIGFLNICLLLHLVLLKNEYFIKQTEILAFCSSFNIDDPKRIRVNSLYFLGKLN